MSALSTVRSDLELYLDAHHAALREVQSVSSAPLAHSLALTRQLISAVDSTDTASALHITFCQTINLLSVSAENAAQQEIESMGCESEAITAEPPGFAGIIRGRTAMNDALPWLPFMYIKYCDGLWSPYWKSVASAQGRGHASLGEPVDPLLFDIICDFAQLTETLLGLARGIPLPGSPQ